MVKLLIWGLCLLLLSKFILGMVYTFNPNTLKQRHEDFWVWGPPGLHSELQASSGAASICAGICVYVCAFQQSLEANLWCQSLRITHLVIWDRDSHWTSALQLHLSKLTSSWPSNPKGLLCMPLPQRWGYSHKPPIHNVLGMIWRVNSGSHDSLASTYLLSLLAPL